MFPLITHEEADMVAEQQGGRSSERAALVLKVVNGIGQ